MQHSVKSIVTLSGVVASFYLHVFVNYACADLPSLSRYTIKKYTIDFSAITPEDLYKLKSPAIGSGIVAIAETPGKATFLMVSDRGPNVDGIAVKKIGERKRESKVFPRPEFTPFVAEVVVTNDQAKVVSITPILNEDGSRSSGLPPRNESSEVALDQSLRPLTTKDNGIDPEGITIINGDQVWIGEEYSPALIKIDRRTGRIVKRLIPGHGLPQILAQRRENRGFEAITSLGSDELFAALQSTLRVPQEEPQSPSFIRFVRVNTKTEKEEMYAYPLNDSTNVDRESVKIGDLAHIKGDQFIAIESGKDREGKKYTRLMLLDTQGATDITHRQVLENGQQRELESAHNLPADLQTIRKKVLLDLGETGWDKEKTEAVTVLSDLRTVVISHDTDFGYSGKATKGEVASKEERVNTELWFITFEDPIQF